MIIKWWKGAKNDLDAIFEYYVALNPQAAVRIYNEILITHIWDCRKNPDIITKFPQ